MTGSTRARREGAIGLILLEHPPVNALSRDLRSALLEHVELLDGDESVRMIVILGVGKHFAAGADIAEFEAGARAPLLSDVLRRIEACGKPVLAAMRGAALGGGAELALACHYRGAFSDLSFGFPEIQLGLIPGAGGTVRLPRLVGGDAAMDLLTSGRRLSRTEALEAGLVDRALEGEHLTATLDWAKVLLAANAPVRRTADVAVPQNAPMDSERAYDRLPRALRRIPAAGEVLSALRAGVTQSLDSELSDARERFERCRRSTESRALRHLFFAERRRPDDAAARPVEHIGVVGAGTMGSGIALCAALQGFEVRLVDQHASVVEAALARIRAHVESACARGKLTLAEGSDVIARVQVGTALPEVASAEFVIEAVVEDLEAKRAVFEALRRIVSPYAVLATNTSALDIDAIASAAGSRADDVVGLHFFSPAQVMRLVELVPGRATSREALATAARVARRMGKLAVPAGNAFGFVGNRMLYAYGREKELMLLEGAAPEQIDAAMEAFGMAMGPNAVGDLAGLDVGWHARRAWAERPADPRYWRAADRLAELGRYGRKTGRGFYRYDEGAGNRSREPDPDALAIIQAEAQRLGVPARHHSDEQIVERCVLALVHQGACLLESGVAQRASDIDVIWCNGYGFPRERGGPMFFGATRGWHHVLSRMHELSREPGGTYWQPPAYLVRLAASES
jgi:3-hydroxyacyl-CoA dehydrogenase